MLLAGLAAAASVLAYGTDPPRDGEIDIPNLDAPVTLAWDDSGRVWVEGPDDVAVAAGLGYAHAVDQGWATALSRQAAAGTLSEWFGADARDLDLHARTLGFTSLARQTYDALDGDSRQLLDAYAQGASTGFAQPGVAQGNAFLVADVVPQAWQPWDALAVERLYAYLSAPALTADSTWQLAAAADSAVARFVAADSAFRAFLGASGGGFDRAYVLRSGTRDPQVALVHHLSAGSSALPMLAPAVLRTGGDAGVALTIPGTLASLSGWSNGRAWAVLSGAPLVLEPYGGPAPPPVFSRITERDGDETLLEVARDTTGLVLRAGVAAGMASDTTAARGWRVRWQGFRLGTDLSAFRALRQGRAPGAFTLLDGDGLLVSTGTRLLGRPSVVAQASGAALIAQDSLARYALSVLSTAADTSAADSTRSIAAVTPADQEVTSGWARDLLPGLLAGLGVRDSLPDVLQTSYAYLNGWDGAYRADGIAPSLFEWWLRSHRELTGHLPDVRDSLDVALLPSSLRIARAELRDRYGPLPTGWRWGRVQGGPVYPVLSQRRMVAAREFRAPLGPPGGHPTAPLPGPSVLFEGPQPGLAVWSIRIRTASGRTEIRSPELRPDPTAGIDLDAGPEGPRLVLDPSAPLPASRLTLTPAS